MQYHYFVDFPLGILVFANFSYGIAVLGTPQRSPPFRRGKTCAVHGPFGSYGNNITTNVKTSTHFIEETYFILFSFE